MSEQWRWERREEKRNNKKYPRPRRAKTRPPFAQLPVDKQLLMTLTGQAQPVCESYEQLEKRVGQPTRRPDAFEQQGITPNQVLRQIRGES